MKTWVWSIPAVAIVGMLVLLLVLNNGTAQKPEDLLEGPAPGPAPAGMVWIPGGTFIMGTELSQDKDAPPHAVSIRSR